MDPYCKLKYNDGAVKREMREMMKTSVKDEAGKNPIWNEEFVFEIESDKDIVF
jgi:Ca2+-dependent lipid-binding protein